VKRIARRLAHRLGYEITRVGSGAGLGLPRDFADADVKLWQQVSHYTMTAPSAVYVLRDAVRHVVEREVPGAIVECGVWRGGSMLAVAQTLLDLGRSDVHLYLFDTFEGMPAPTEEDILWTGESAAALLEAEDRGDESLLWAQAGVEAVANVMRSVPYPQDNVHLVQGMVEDTVPDGAPDAIALLRIDTDWYASTKHELIHLYPRLAPGGVLIIDDYGWWRGARQATDEYFAEHPPVPFLVRIDHEGRRVAVKPG
jgi:O-methyltransferase